MITMKRNGWSWSIVALCCLFLVVTLAACSDDGGEPPSGPSGSDCEDDADCDGDEVCDTESGECVGCVDATDCDGDELCDDGSCVECIGDDDCAGDDVCRLGSCAECNEDADCDDGEVCRSGECVDDDDDPCDGVDCPSGEFCDPDLGLCVESEADEGYACEVPEELHSLSEGDSISLSMDTTDQPRSSGTSCDDSDGGHAVVKLAVDEEMLVEVTLEDQESPLAMEVREGDCGDEEAAIWDDPQCIAMYEGVTQNFEAQPDTDYYIIIDSFLGAEAGEFTIDISAEGVFCLPRNEYRCAEGDIRRLCHNNQEYRDYECATDCEDNTCFGHRCDNPIEVTGAMTLEGNVNAYEDNFDFRPHPECSTDGLDTIELEGRRSVGQDIIFHFPALESGQVVYIDSTGGTADSTSYFGVVETCDKDNIECIGGEDQDQILEWEVPDSGDYYVIWNQSQVPTNDETFQFEIDILD